MASCAWSSCWNHSRSEVVTVVSIICVSSSFLRCHISTAPIAIAESSLLPAPLKQPAANLRLVPNSPPQEHGGKKRATYRGHSKIALEASPDTVVNTLGLAPCGVDPHEAVALVAHEALRAWISEPPRQHCCSQMIHRLESRNGGVYVGSHRAGDECFRACNRWDR